MFFAAVVIFASFVVCREPSGHYEPSYEGCYDTTLQHDAHDDTMFTMDP